MPLRSILHPLNGIQRTHGFCLKHKGAVQESYTARGGSNIISQDKRESITGKNQERKKYIQLKGRSKERGETTELGISALAHKKRMRLLLKEKEKEGGRDLNQK